MAMSRKVGVKHAFCFGKYHNLTREQAVVASSLCDMEDLVADLHKVSHSLEFKYSDLKTGLKETLKQYPGIVERFPVEEQSDLSSKLSESILGHLQSLQEVVQAAFKVPRSLQQGL